MRTIIPFIAILLFTFLLTACSTDSNRLLIEPTEEVAVPADISPQKLQKPGLSTLKSISQLSSVTPSDLEPEPCQEFGYYYVSSSFSCGPLIKTKDGDLYLPMENNLSLNASQLKKPLKIQFTAVPTQYTFSEIGDAKSCENMKAVFLTCLTILE